MWGAAKCHWSLLISIRFAKPLTTNTPRAFCSNWAGGAARRIWDEILGRKNVSFTVIRAVRQNLRYVYLYFLHRDKFGT